MARQIWLGVSCAILVLSMSARAVDSSRVEELDFTPPNVSGARFSRVYETPVGLGPRIGSVNGERGYALTIEGQDHFDQRKLRSDLTRYGQDESRLELGEHSAISLATTLGAGIGGLSQGRKASWLLGIEPFNARLTIAFGGGRKSYYEWLPMVSGGPQFAVGSCRFLPLMRGGGALGDFGKDGLIPALGWSYGAGAYLNCSKLDWATELTRFLASGRNADIAVADISYRLSPRGWRVGLRVESELLRAPGSSEPLYSLDPADARSEQRVLLLVRGEFLR